MILNGVNSDDYIYLRVLEKTRVPGSLVEYEPGTIIRINVKNLRKNIWKWQVQTNLMQRVYDPKTFNYTDEFIYLEFTPEENLKPTAILPRELYSKVTVKEDFDIVLPVQYGDLLLINDWLSSKLSSDVPFIRFQMPFSSYLSVSQFNDEFLRFGKLKSSDTPKESLALLGINTEVMQYVPDEEYIKKAFPGNNIICKSGDSICLQFKKGEVIDFKDPGLSLLFLDQDWVRCLLKTEYLKEDEKKQQFIADFSGWLPECNRRYYKLHDDLKIKSLNDFMDPDVWETAKRIAPDLHNVFYNNYWRYSPYDNFDFDSEGYLRYVWCSEEIEFEHEIAKIATPVSADLGRIHYLHELNAKKLDLMKRTLEMRAKSYLKSHKSRYHKLLRGNPNLTPVEFLEIEEKREQETQKQFVRRLAIALNKRKEDLEDNIKN